MTNIENFVEIRLSIICLNYSSGHSSSQNSVEIFVEKSVGNCLTFLRSKAGSWTPIDLPTKEREFDAEEMSQSSREERSMNLDVEN